MSYKLELSKSALSDIEKHKKSGDAAILKKLRSLFLELMQHPYSGTGQPEMLKGDLQGFYSRRINRKHKIIYKIEEEVVEVYILRAYGHYDDR